VVGGEERVADRAEGGGKEEVKEGGKEGVMGKVGV